MGKEVTIDEEKVICNEIPLLDFGNKVVIRGVLFANDETEEGWIADFFRRTENILGFKPYIILIDVAYNTSAKIENFEGIDNVMMVPPNPASIELFLTNFRDMDTYDVYTPLLSVYRSKRYSPIRDFVYKVKKKAKSKEVLV